MVFRSAAEQISLLCCCRFIAAAPRPLHQHPCNRIATLQRMALLWPEARRAELPLELSDVRVQLAAPV